MTKKNKRPMFYLKVNKWDKNAQCSLNFWLKVLEITKSDYYIICDSPATTRWLSKIRQEEHIIPSDREQASLYINKIGEMDEIWKRAFAAHVTTFLHAAEHGYDNFWNIDADDTMMMIPDKKIKDVFEGIEDYAAKNHIDGFSYDIHRSNLLGKHWSYGITYIQNPKKWKDTFANFDVDKWAQEKLKFSFLNIDWFTTYLKDNNILNIQTFYIDKMYFLHNSMPFTNGSLSLMLHHKGIVEYPIFKEIYKVDQEKISYFPIYKDIIKFDFGLTKIKSLNAIKNNMFDYNLYLKEARKYFPEYTK